MTHLINALTFYYRHCGHRIVLFFAALFMSGFLELIGVAAFLPILTSAQTPNEIFNLANIPYLGTLLKSIHIPPLSVTVSQLLLVVGIIFIAKAVASVFLITSRTKIITRLGVNLRVGMTARLHECPYQKFTTLKLGHVQNTIISEVDRIIDSFRNFNAMLVGVVTSTVYFLIALLAGGNYLGYVLLSALLLLPILRGANRYAKKVSHQQTERGMSMTHLLQQFLSHMKYFKATGEDHVRRTLDTSIGLYVQSAARRDMLNLIYGTLIEPLALLAVLVLLYVKLQDGAISFISFGIAAGAIYKMATRLLGVPKSYNQFLTSVASLSAYKNLELQLAGVGLSPRLTAPGATIAFQSQIRFQDVSFSYDAKPVLNRVNLEIKKNQTIGLVGASGHGKTTLFDLLVGLLTPSSGDILIDEKSYRQVDQRSLTALFGYVTQEPIIFNDSLLNNVSLWDTGRVDAVRVQVDQALGMSGSKSFVDQLPNGLGTILGERGVVLSGGQRQRIAIARELYRNTPILILDEATSALDSASEAMVQESIENLAGKKTLLIISHRLSTVKKCDYIYFIENGTIVESGTWKDLIALTEGQFAKMSRVQGVGGSSFSGNRENHI